MSKRLCTVDDRLGYFHCWENYADVISPSLMVGGSPGGQISRVYGIVEFSDGVQKVAPQKIKFVDEENLFLQQSADNETEENKIEVIVYALTNAHRKVLIRHMEEKFNGLISFKAHCKDRITISIARCCDVHFYSFDPTKLKGIMPPKYVYSQNTDVANYLYDKGARIAISFDELLRLIKEDIYEMRHMQNTEGIE